VGQRGAAVDAHGDLRHGQPHQRAQPGRPEPARTGTQPSTTTTTSSSCQLLFAPRGLTPSTGHCAKRSNSNSAPIGFVAREPESGLLTAVSASKSGKMQRQARWSSIRSICFFFPISVDYAVRTRIILMPDFQHRAQKGDCESATTISPAWVNNSSMRSQKETLLPILGCIAREDLYSSLLYIKC
jgi:hypothetical protein